MSLWWEMADQSGEKDQRKISDYVIFLLHVALDCALLNALTRWAMNSKYNR